MSISKWEERRLYLFDLHANTGAAKSKLDSLERWTEEKLQWLERVDEAVDEIAEHFQITIPYRLVSEARYNPAARLEMLKRTIRGEDD